jgi:DNA-binding Xre family transcriptional regulator
MLARSAKISISTLSKMSRDGSVNTDILVKICNALDLAWRDIAELVPDEENGAHLPEGKGNQAGL